MCVCVCVDVEHSCVFNVESRLLSVVFMHYVTVSPSYIGLQL